MRPIGLMMPQHTQVQESERGRSSAFLQSQSAGMSASQTQAFRLSTKSQRTGPHERLTRVERYRGGTFGGRALSVEIVSCMKLGTVSPVSPSTVRKKNCFSLGRQSVGISPALFVAEGRDSWPCPSSHSYVSSPRNHSLCHLFHLYILLGVLLKR